MKHSLKSLQGAQILSLVSLIKQGRVWYKFVKNLHWLLLIFLFYLTTSILLDILYKDFAYINIKLTGMQFSFNIGITFSLLQFPASLPVLQKFLKIANRFLGSSLLVLLYLWYNTSDLKVPEYI